MIVELDRIGLETLVRGSSVDYGKMNDELIKKAGHEYVDSSGRTYWNKLKDLTDEELFEVYKICKDSWID